MRSYQELKDASERETFVLTGEGICLE